MPKLTMEINRMTGRGIYIKRVLDNLSTMKCELEALGCKVQIKVEGTELAGNEARTRDLLLGKNSVTLEGETIAKYGPTEENDNNQKQCYLEHRPKWQLIDNFTNDGWSTTAFFCPVCWQNRYEIEAVAE